MESLLEPAISLPSLRSSSSNLFEEEMIGAPFIDDEGSFSLHPTQSEAEEDITWDSIVVRTPGHSSYTKPFAPQLNTTHIGAQDDGSDFEEGCSMTLRDILLQTGISGCDLLSESLCFP